MRSVTINTEHNILLYSQFYNEHCSEGSDPLPSLSKIHNFYSKAVLLFLICCGITEIGGYGFRGPRTCPH